MSSQSPLDYRGVIGQIARKHGALVTVFSDFCRMGACCFAAQTREEEYLEVAGRYSREELDLFSEALAGLVLEMERSPFKDLLGPYYLEVASKATQEARGEFYTPPEISRMMAQMLFDAEKLKEEDHSISILEPACGAGGMILAIGELFAPAHVHLLRVTCWDLNPVAADMCYLYTTLWGIPAEIVWGDTLRNIAHRTWKNIHWARVCEDMRRQLVGLFDSPSQSDVKLPREKTGLSEAAYKQMNFKL